MPADPTTAGTSSALAQLHEAELDAPRPDAQRGSLALNPLGSRHADRMADVPRVGDCGGPDGDGALPGPM